MLSLDEATAPKRPAKASALRPQSAALLDLQRRAGNAAVSRLLQPRAIQRQLCVQREIVDARGQPMSPRQIRAAIDRDPSARINNERTVAQLWKIFRHEVRFTIEEVISALGGGPRPVQRAQEGDLVLHPPLPVDELYLADIAGTHRSVAKTFSNPSFTVEGTAGQLAANPNLVRDDVFVLTVFRATPPGAPTGPVSIWSMNNRRLKAMQEADRRLRQHSRALPKVRVQWATKDDMNHAVGPGKFNNPTRAEVGFHNVSTQTQRLAVLTASNASSRPSADAVAAALASGDAETIAKTLGF